MKLITLLISSGVPVPLTPIKTFSGAVRTKLQKQTRVSNFHVAPTSQIVLISLQ